MLKININNKDSKITYKTIGVYQAYYYGDKRYKYMYTPITDSNTIATIREELKMKGKKFVKHFYLPESPNKNSDEYIRVDSTYYRLTTYINDKIVLKTSKHGMRTGEVLLIERSDGNVYFSETREVAVLDDTTLLIDSFPDYKVYIDSVVSGATNYKLTTDTVPNFTTYENMLIFNFSTIHDFIHNTENVKINEIINDEIEDEQVTNKYYSTEGKYKRRCTMDDLIYNYFTYSADDIKQVTVSGITYDKYTFGKSKYQNPYREWVMYYKLPEYDEYHNYKSDKKYFIGGCGFDSNGNPLMNEDGNGGVLVTPSEHTGEDNRKKMLWLYSTGEKTNEFKETLLNDYDTIDFYCKDVRFFCDGMGWVKLDNIETVEVLPMPSYYELYNVYRFKREEENCDYYYMQCIKEGGKYIWVNVEPKYDYRLEDEDEHTYGDLKYVNGSLYKYRDVLLPWKDFRDCTTVSFSRQEGAFYIPLTLGEMFSTNTNKETSLNEIFLEQEIEKNINEIVDYEKAVFVPMYYDSDVFDEDAIDDTLLKPVKSIKYNLHFRQRQYTKDEDGYRNYGEWKTDDTQYWNSFYKDYDSDDNSFHIKNDIEEDKLPTFSDLLSDLGFCDEDVYYRKQKLKKSFIRLSFYDTRYKANQTLQYYSTMFLDAGRLYKKYLNVITSNTLKKGELNIASENEDKNYRVSCDFECRSKYDKEMSSEGFYLYMFPSIVSGNSFTSIYLKVEFNNAKYGSTVTMSMPYTATTKGDWPISPSLTNKNFPINYVRRDSENRDSVDIPRALRDIFIRILVKYDKEKNQYIWLFPRAMGDTDGNVEINLWEPRINGLGYNEKSIRKVINPDLDPEEEKEPDIYGSLYYYRWKYNGVVVYDSETNKGKLRKTENLTWNSTTCTSTVTCECKKKGEDTWVDVTPIMSKQSSNMSGLTISNYVSNQVTITYLENKTINPYAQTILKFVATPMVSQSSTFKVLYNQYKLGVDIPPEEEEPTVSYTYFWTIYDGEKELYTSNGKNGSYKYTGLTYNKSEKELHIDFRYRTSEGVTGIVDQKKDIETTSEVIQIKDNANKTSYIISCEENGYTSARTASFVITSNLHTEDTESGVGVLELTVEQAKFPEVYTYVYYWAYDGVIQVDKSGNPLKVVSLSESKGYLPYTGYTCEHKIQIVYEKIGKNLYGKETSNSKGIIEDKEIEKKLQSDTFPENKPTCDKLTDVGKYKFALDKNDTTTRQRTVIWLFSTTHTGLGDYKLTINFEQEKKPVTYTYNLYWTIDGVKVGTPVYETVPKEEGNKTFVVKYEGTKDGDDGSSVPLSSTAVTCTQTKVSNTNEDYFTYTYTNNNLNLGYGLNVSLENSPEIHFVFNSVDEKGNAVEPLELIVVQDLNVTVIPAFDYFHFSYEWENESTNTITDLDSLTVITFTPADENKEKFKGVSVQTDNGIEYIKELVCGYDTKYEGGLTDKKISNYLDWSQDNKWSGAEGAMINFKQICSQIKETDNVRSIVMDVYAHWYNNVGKNGEMNFVYNGYIDGDQPYNINREVFEISTINDVSKTSTWVGKNTFNGMAIKCTDDKKYYRITDISNDGYLQSSKWEQVDSGKTFGYVLKEGTKVSFTEKESFFINARGGTVNLGGTLENPPEAYESSTVKIVGNNNWKKESYTHIIQIKYDLKTEQHYLNKMDTTLIRNMGHNLKAVYNDTVISLSERFYHISESARTTSSAETEVTITLPKIKIINSDDTKPENTDSNLEYNINKCFFYYSGMREENNGSGNYITYSNFSKSSFAEIIDKRTDKDGNCVLKVKVGKNEPRNEDGNNKNRVFRVGCVAKSSKYGEFWIAKTIVQEYGQ